MRRIRSTTAVISLAVAVTLAVPVTPLASASPETGAVQAVRVAADRLALADHVAAAKWPQRSPIHDQRQADAVVDGAVANPRAHGLSPAHVRTVMRDQIAAGESVQYGLFAEWTVGAKTPPPRPDLSAVRARIAALTAHLLSALSETHSTTGCRSAAADEIRAQIADRRWDASHARALRAAAAHLCD